MGSWTKLFFFIVGHIDMNVFSIKLKFKLSLKTVFWNVSCNCVPGLLKNSEKSAIANMA